LRPKSNSVPPFAVASVFSFLALVLLRLRVLGDGVLPSVIEDFLAHSAPQIFLAILRRPKSEWFSWEFTKAAIEGTG
jgi:hypothetical protein